MYEQGEKDLQDKGRKPLQHQVDWRRRTHNRQHAKVWPVREETSGASNATLLLSTSVTVLPPKPPPVILRPEEQAGKRPFIWRQRGPKKRESSRVPLLPSVLVTVLLSLFLGRFFLLALFRSLSALVHLYGWCWTERIQRKKGVTPCTKGETRELSHKQAAGAYRAP